MRDKNFSFGVLEFVFEPNHTILKQFLINSKRFVLFPLVMQATWLFFNSFRSAICAISVFWLSTNQHTLFETSYTFSWCWIFFSLFIYSSYSKSIFLVSPQSLWVSYLESPYWIISHPWVFHHSSMIPLRLISSIFLCLNLCFWFK